LLLLFGVATDFITVELAEGGDDDIGEFDFVGVVGRGFEGEIEFWFAAAMIFVVRLGADFLLLGNEIDGSFAIGSGSLTFSGESGATGDELPVLLDLE